LVFVDHTDHPPSCAHDHEDGKGVGERRGHLNTGEQCAPSEHSVQALGCFKKWGIELLCLTLSIVSEDLEMEIVLMSA
jgi:hypothetical protein